MKPSILFNSLDNFVTSHTGWTVLIVLIAITIFYVIYDKTIKSE